MELLKYHTAETQEWVDTVLRPLDDLRPGSQVHAADVLTTSLALSELVVWVRNVHDRVDRWDRVRKYRLGLLPALEPGPLRNQVTLAWQRFTESAPDVRLLANYTAHHSALPFPGAAADIDAEWNVSLRVPNPPPANVYAPELLTYHKWPKAVPYAEDLFAATKMLIDDTMSAFRSAQAGRRE